MQVADNDLIRNDAHAHHLPVSWMTLYELSKIDENTFTAAIEDGRINPKMERKTRLRCGRIASARREQSARVPKIRTSYRLAFSMFRAASMKFSMGWMSQIAAIC